MIYTWKLSRLRNLFFDTERPIVIGGQAMAMDCRSKRIRGRVISASPKIVVLKTSQGTRRLSRAAWTIAPIYGEQTTMPCVPARARP
jgi:hypothetical protein